jgi:predicted transposase YdaD
VQIIGLVVAKKRQFLEKATELIDRVKKQFTHEPTRLELLNLLEAIIIAKLPKLSRRELEIMFGVEDLRNTRFAQELMEEATLKIIPRLLSKGFSVEEIAEIIDLSADKVREYINNMN